MTIKKRVEYHNYYTWCRELKVLGADAVFHHTLGECSLITAEYGGCIIGMWHIGTAKGYLNGVEV